MLTEFGPFTQRDHDQSDLIYKTRTRAQCIFMSIFIVLNSNFSYVLQDEQTSDVGGPCHVNACVHSSS